MGAFTILLLSYYGTRLVNGVSSWWYDRGTAQQNQIIQGLQQEANEAKAVAAEALAALAKEKEVGAAEKKKREIAEGILSDKSKNTDAKIKAYEEAIGKQPTVTPVGSVDQLCERARAAGIVCEE